MRKILMPVLVFVLAGAPALAAQDTTIVRRSGDGFLVDFQNQQIGLVISALAEAAGLNVTFGNLGNRVTTLRLNQPIQRNEVIDVLRNIVESNGLRMVEDGQVYRIEVVQVLTPAQQAALNQGQAAPQLVYTYRLRHANAIQLANTLSQVFAPSAGRGGGAAVQIFQPAAPPGGRGGAAGQQGAGGRGGAAGAGRGGGGGGRGGRGGGGGDAGAPTVSLAVPPVPVTADRAVVAGERVQLQIDRLGQMLGNDRLQQALASGGGEALAQVRASFEQAAVALQAQAAAQQAAQQGIQQGISGEVRVIPEESTNSLIIRATAADYLTVLQLIQSVDLRPPQVLIEVLIAEVRRTSTLDFGISGTGVYTKRGNTNPNATLSSEGTGVTDPRAFVLQLSGGRGTIDFEVALRALQARGTVHVLSLPLIFGQNNREASLVVGARVPFVSLSQTLPTDNGVRNELVEYQDVGTNLTITPTINPDGYVNLQVTQSANSVTNEIQFGAPIINQREASTQIFVRDGQTAVIGGLADNQKTRTRTGIPYLNRIPFLGALFGETVETDLVSELFLFLTPHVVSTDGDTDRIREAIKEGSELLQGVNVEPLINVPPAATIIVPPPPPPATQVNPGAGRAGGAGGRAGGAGGRGGAVPPPTTGGGPPPPTTGGGAPPPPTPPPASRIR